MYAIKDRPTAPDRGEVGSISIEYAFVIVIGVALAALLLALVTSDQMHAYLAKLVMPDQP